MNTVELTSNGFIQIKKTRREKMKVFIARIDKEAKLPKYEHEDDAGMDLYANENVIIRPGEIKLIGTGIRMALPEGIEAQVRPKSGLAANHGITVLNTPGTIDAGYRGEIKVIIANFGKESYKVEKGKKIAQIVFNKIEKPEIIETKELNETKRGAKGFGSTGLE